MKRTIIIVLVVLGLGALIGFRLMGNKKKIEENNKVVDRSTIAIPVVTVKAGLKSTEGNFSLVAETEPVHEARLMANSPGRLEGLNIELGSYVKKGQVLGNVDVDLKKLNLTSTQLLIDKAERDYKNLKELYEAKAASENDYKNAEYAWKNAKAQADLIERQIADGRIISPISGIVIDKKVETGEYLNPGTPMASIVDISRLKATVMVGESDVYKLKEGMKVNVTTDVYPDLKYSGEIRYVSPQGDASHNYPVEVVMDNSGKNPLKSGTFVRVAFELQAGEPVLSIPKTALVEGITNPFVYIVQGDRAESRKLILGRESGEFVEVVQGLKEGEEVVLSGQINLSEGSLIEVISN